MAFELKGFTSGNVYNDTPHPGLVWKNRKLIADPKRTVTKGGTTSVIQGCDVRCTCCGGPHSIPQHFDLYLSQSCSLSPCTDLAPWNPRFAATRVLLLESSIGDTCTYYNQSLLNAIESGFDTVACGTLLASFNFLKPRGNNCVSVGAYALLTWYGMGTSNCDSLLQIYTCIDHAGIPVYSYPYYPFFEYWVNARPTFDYCSVGCSPRQGIDLYGGPPPDPVTHDRCYPTDDFVFGQCGLPSTWAGGVDDATGICQHAIFIPGDPCPPPGGCSPYYYQDPCDDSCPQSCGFCCGGGLLCVPGQPGA